MKKGIGTSSGSGVSAACANNSTTSSPPNQQSSNQHLPKNSSTNNQNDTKDNLTSPSKSHLTKIQKSPSDSHSSKNDTEKMRPGKSRNKEGMTTIQFNATRLNFNFPNILQFRFFFFFL